MAIVRAREAKTRTRTGVGESPKTGNANMIADTLRKQRA
jgi:hypothetical protein